MKNIMHIIIVAVCTSACMNGGICTSPEVCTCQAGWTGNHCQEGKNNKSSAYLLLLCIIGADCFSDKYFSTYIAVCTPSCMNGGTCTSPGICSCAEGWSGVRCQEGIAICTPLILNCFTETLLTVL